MPDKQREGAKQFVHKVPKKLQKRGQDKPKNVSTETKVPMASQKNLPEPEPATRTGALIKCDLKNDSSNNKSSNGSSAEDVPDKTLKNLFLLAKVASKEPNIDFSTQGKEHVAAKETDKGTSETTPEAAESQQCVIKL